MIRVSCPGKINLALKVLGRREDGFHEIVTVFQAIDLADRLIVGDAEALTLETADTSIPRDGTNLVLRAAALLRERVPAAAGRGAAFHLEKRLPVGGGLGGGSSDAAGALVALDRLWQLGLSEDALRGLAAELGSDVPFFLAGGTALGTGRGEIVERLPSIPARDVVLGVPRGGLLTSEVYRALGRALTPTPRDVTVTRFFVKLAERNDFALATNDLEEAAFVMRGDLVAFRDALRASGAELALLSGSGSSVFGVFRAEKDAASIALALRREFPDWAVHRCRTVASGVRVETADEERDQGLLGQR
ncbi:MAG TPA: 4-(cytidine 5'-diphospho)-2-C-methyl-D-erythritol kinase [Candidatus Polarisedimenticolaceae bacterium]|nr:4-(cytidine 5'-diphospho)-2-C-methyl-D-erythritol kinase [Candidatus Polarisedimenticolaceae bacterium]